MNNDTETPVQSMELAVVQTAITKMDRLTAGLADLAKRFSGVVFDVTSAKGMAEAKAARREIAAPRIEVEKIRKEAKAPILELGRKLDAEAQRITKELQKIEGPIDQQIVAEENRLEAERQAKVRAEQDRQAALLQRLADIRGAIQVAAKSRTSEDVAQILRDISAVVVDDSFAEYQEVAAKARTETIAELKLVFDNLVEREETSKRQAAQQAELDRRQAEQDARDRAASERDEAERARVRDIERDINMLRTFGVDLTAMSSTTTIELRIEELKRRPVTAALYDEFVQQALDARDASLARLDVVYVAACEYQREQGRQAAESARIAREAAELAERQRIEREAAEARERAEQEARDKAAREAAEECARNYVPAFDEIVDVVATHYKRPSDTVRNWIKPARQQAKAA